MKMVVAQMYNCIRMEFRKCFHSHNFIISMATCVLLALSSASYCCQGYLNIYLLQHLFNNWFLSLDLPRLAAAAVLVALVLLVVILGLLKWWDHCAKDE